MIQSDADAPTLRFVVCDEDDEVMFCCPRCGAKDLRLYAVDADDGLVGVVVSEENITLHPGRGRDAEDPTANLRVLLHFVCSAGHDFYYRFRVCGKRTFAALNVEDDAQDDLEAGEGRE